MTRTPEENAERAAALMAHLHALKGTLGGETEAWRAPSPVETYRDLYVRGAIDLETFEARLDVYFSERSCR